MLMTHQAQATALGELLRRDRLETTSLVNLVDAVLECTEQLMEWGDAQGAQALLDETLRRHAALPIRQTMRLQAQRLRTLALLHHDHECLEQVQSLLVRHKADHGAWPDEYAAFRVLEATALWHLNRTAEAIPRLIAVREELLHRPDSLVLARALTILSSCHINDGRWDRAREYALEAWFVARRIGSPYQQGLALGNLCIAERGRCRYASSIDAGEEAVALLDGIGATVRAGHVRRSLAITQFRRGRLDEASRTLDGIVGSTGTADHREQARYTTLLRALLDTQAGRFDEARARLAPPTEPIACLKESRPEMLRLEYLGDVALEEGDVHAALVQYEALLPHALALVPRGDIVAELRRRRAECWSHMGRHADAYDEARAGIDLCLELGDRYEEAAIWRTLATSAAALGRADEARQHFTHAFAIHDDLETPYEWGRLWLAYGDWLAGPHAGAYASIDGAREAYRAAAEHFERVGAPHRLTEARQRIASLADRVADEGLFAAGLHEPPRPRRRPSLDRELQRRVQWAHDTFGLVTRHAPMLDLLEQVSRVAASDIPVLVLGESGTGKELIARGVHGQSGRTGRLVEVNCSAVPAAMMEAEFFGSVHGSYTGSMRDRAGLFEEAHDGSIFLDEVGEMSVDLQAKLLRFLETGEVRRIGANAGREVDSRLIAATNREASRMQAGEGFRQDLYYRLAHAVFTLPPLRARGDDAALLVDHFLEEFQTRERKKVTLARTVRERLEGHTWPGNVRELRALMQRLVVMASDGQVITPRDLPHLESGETPRNFTEEIESEEKTRIMAALERMHYVKAEAARALRMSRTTLLGKMKRYGIEV